jgi:hypothetical protein
MKHVCTICNYDTDRLSNYNKHMSTKKHIHKKEAKKGARKEAGKTLYGKIGSNMDPNCIRILDTFPNKIDDEPIIIDNILPVHHLIKTSDHKCQYCNEVFKYKTNLIRHIKSRCSEKKDKDTEIETLKKEVDYLKSLLDGYKNIAVSATETSKVSVSSMNYVLMNYKDAPAIQIFNNFKILFVGNEKYSMAQIAIHYYDKKGLAKFIGDKLLLEYKKEDPKKQSVWNTDSNRQSYLLRENNGEDCEWNTDKEGVKISEYMVKPALEYIKKDVVKHIADSNTRIINDDEMDKMTRSEVLNNMKDGGELINIINTGELNKDIIKYMSPFLYLNKKEIK